MRRRYEGMLQKRCTLPDPANRGDVRNRSIPTLYALTLAAQHSVGYRVHDNEKRDLSLNHTAARAESGLMGRFRKSSYWPHALIALSLVGALALQACSAGNPRNPASGNPTKPGAASFRWGEPVDLKRSWAPAPITSGGLTRIAETSGRRLILHTKGGEVDFVPGVNIGPTVPGQLPGEHALESGEYRRWFPQIASVGLRAVRVYTVLPPWFYEELARYNRLNPGAPIYLVQGVWIPEEEFYTTLDLYSPAVRVTFKQEITDAVGAVHGDLVRADLRGHASGTYTADVSPWLLAYSIGVEWDPRATRASDRANKGRAPYSGDYFSSTRKASPTETWLAEMLDHTALAEAQRGVSVPLTFTNWPTTDPLDHPDEPHGREDIVGVDANHIRVAGGWHGGYFASYHAYPYYPDFMRHEPRLASYEHAGRIDPYAGYLHRLREHHSDMPLMITEFGVPSGLGVAHLGPLGRDQGDHSEQEAMTMNAEMLRIIHDLELAGGFVFEWTDEWFKFTWNTIDYELPRGRRQLWRNPLTNEEHFGLVSVEPGDSPAVVIDGDAGEWENNESQVIHEARTGVRAVRAVKDEAYLYLLVVLDEENASEPELTLGFDVLPGGNRGLPGAPGLGTDADYAVTFTSDGAQAWVRASNDPEAILYGKVRRYFHVDAKGLKASSGVWNPQTQILNRPLVVPSTGQELPIEEFNVGELRRGSSDPTDPSFDSRSLWAATPDGFEIRLPYQMIGFADPSSRRALVITPSGGVRTAPVDRVGISAALNGEEYKTEGYSWGIWNVVAWHQRPKVGLAEFASAVAEVLGR